MRYRDLLSFFVGLLLPMVAFGKTKKKRAVSCAQASQLSLKFNPSFMVKREKLNLAKQRLKAARIFPTNPELGSTGKGKGNSQKWSPYKFELNLSWKLPVGGRWGRMQRRAKAHFLRSQTDFQLERFLLMLKAQQACFKYLLQKEKVLLYREVRAFYKRVHRIVTKRKQRGAATVLELNLARLEWLQSRASLELAIADEKALRRSLFQLLGPKVEEQITISDKLVTRLNVKQSTKDLLKKALQDNLIVRSYDLRIREALANLKWSEAKAIPDVKVKLYYSFEEGNNHIVGGGLSMALPVLWRNQRKVWSNQSKLRQARLRLRAIKFSLRQRVLLTFTRLQAGWNVYQLYEQKLIPTMKKQIQLRERGLKAGAFTILQVISAQQSQNKARLKRLLSLKQVLKNYFDLQYALGNFL